MSSACARGAVRCCIDRQKTGVWQEIIEKTAKYRDQAKKYQNADGAFSTSFFSGPGDAADKELRINQWLAEKQFAPRWRAYSSGNIANLYRFAEPDDTDALVKMLTESGYFEPQWQDAYWGAHYPRLREVKRKYDPDGIFFSHHGVGSEDWSSDGFAQQLASILLR